MGKVDIVCRECLTLIVEFHSLKFNGYYALNILCEECEKKAIKGIVGEAEE